MKLDSPTAAQERERFLKMVRGQNAEAEGCDHTDYMGQTQKRMLKVQTK